MLPQEGLRDALGLEPHRSNHSSPPMNAWPWVGIRNLFLGRPTRSLMGSMRLPFSYGLMMGAGLVATPGTHSISAELTLREYRAGRMEFDW